MFFQNIIFYIYSICLLFSLISGIAGRTARIVGANDADIKDFPYHATIKRMADYTQICGGAIISHKHVITAAHCVPANFVSSNVLMIYVGKALQQRDFYESIFGIDQIYIHPEFYQYEQTEPNFTVIINDIAVIKIQGTIRFNEYQNKINLPTKDIFMGDLLTFSGWGSKAYPVLQSPNKLQQTWMTITDNIACRFHCKFDISDGQFCAFRNIGVGACVGDSGSPIVSEDKLIGILSMCCLCATGIPDVFTKIYHYVDYINSILAL